MPHSILVVDDEEPVRQSLELVLRFKGYDVTSVMDGSEALEVVAKLQPDLVITDIIMPGIDGIETILAMKQRHPRIKVIAMSGGGRVSGQDYLTLARQSGADATLDKPFAMDHLIKTIDACFPT